MNTAPPPLHLEVLACFIMPNQLFCLFSHLKGEEYYSFFVSLSFDKFLVLEIAFKIWSKSSKLFVLVLLWVLTGKRGGFPEGTEVKSTPANTRDKRVGVRFLSQEDALEQQMAMHSNILAWRIP